MFAPRFITGRCAEYPLLAFQLQANLTDEEYLIIANGAEVSTRLYELRRDRAGLNEPLPASATEAERAAHEEALPERTQQLDAAIAAEKDLIRVRFGETVSRAFKAGRYEGYGVVLDFSTADAALLTLSNRKLPRDLRHWLRNAPLGAVDYELKRIDENFQMSFETHG